MGKSSPKAPAAPDPLQSAQAQAQVNRLNQFFPGGGSVLYGQYGADGSFAPDYSHSAVQLTENPYQRQTREMSERLSQQLANILGGNLNLPAMQSGINYQSISRLPTIDDFSSDAKRVEDATYSRISNLLKPEFDNRRAERTQELTNQGIPLGAEAYQTEFDNLDKKQNDLLQNAALDAVNAGRSEQQRLFANSLASRQSQINDQLQSVGLNNNARASMLQELASLLGGQQFSPQQFQGGINAPQVDVLGAINSNYSGQLNTYNNQMARQQGLLQNAARLGTGLFSFL